MACKNNKKNRRKITFYGISKFDYETRKKLAKGQPPLKKIPIKEKVVEYSPENAQIENWTAKITAVQTNS